MMLKLIAELKENNVSIWVSGEKIQLSYGDEAPASELIASIKKDKSAIVDFLSQHKIDSQHAFHQFRAPTSTSERMPTTAGQPEGGGAEIEALFPASSLQQGFVYHHLSQPEDVAYRVQLTWDYHYELDVALWQQAWRLASLRYPALRTAFDWQGEILQVITSAAGIKAKNFSIEDLSATPSESHEAQITQIQQQDLQKPFDLSQPGLIRFTVIKQHSQLFTVIKTEHHSIADGWSGPVLMQTVHAYYEALVRGQVPDVKAETAYLAAQQWYLKHQDATQQYWREAKQQLGTANDINLLLSRKLDLSLGAQQGSGSVQSTEQGLNLEGSAYRQLKAMCQNLGVTLNVAVQFAWHKLLHSYTGDAQTIVGTTVSGRDIPIDGIESSVGLYINTLPLTVSWDDDNTIQAQLALIQNRIAALNSYSRVSLADLQSNGERLFHSLLVFENYPMPAGGGAEASDPTLAESMVGRNVVQNVDYPLMVLAYEQHGLEPEDSSLMIKLQYGQSWLDDTQAKRLLNQMQQILTAMAANPDQAHQGISLIDEQQRSALLSHQNHDDDDDDDRAHDDVLSGTLHQVFEQQVLKTPDNIALVLGEESLSYRQLNEQANHLAHVIRASHLQRHGQALSADTLIALYLDRSLSMVISILAVLKAGGAYVPISPEHPQERVGFILSDCGATLVLTEQAHLQTLDELLTETGSLAVLLTADNLDVTAQCVSQANPESVSGPDDLAYVIYTSGTTGQPKGVAITHGASVGRNHSMAQRGQTANNTYLFKTSYIFDVSVSDLFSHLSVGAKVVITRSSFDVAEIKAAIKQHAVNACHFVPAQFSALSAAMTEKLALDQLYFSGESLCAEQLRLIDFSRTRVVNYYGPTETGEATSYLASRESDNIIGQPFNGVRVYVMQNSQHLAPVGLPGELYISGAGLARGYLNRPQLTAEHFGDNPFASEQDKAKGYGRWYKTGDLVRWLQGADGEYNLEYLGRNDSQVKIRGFRIELGEIEQVLMEQTQVEQAVLSVRSSHPEAPSGGEKVLAAYIVTREGQAFDVDQLCAGLSAKLPDYMLPTTFTQIDKVPLTINGKLDRRALPEPQRPEGQGHVAPRNDKEEKLCAIWQNILGLAEVGIEDNFFRVGGHSINAIRLMAAIREELGIDVPLALLFEYPTVAELGRHLQGGLVDVIPHVEQAHYPLSFAQARLLFIERFEKGTDAYHIPYYVKLSSNSELEVLTRAFNLVINRHTVLKSVYFDHENGETYQRVLNDDVLMQTRQLADEDALACELKADIAQPFDLGAEPSVRLHHYDVVANGEQYLLMLFHHIAFDGWSTDIFLGELAEAYQALTVGREVHLPELTIQYGDYALWQQEVLQGESLDALVSYWQQQLGGFEILALPTDHPRPLKPDYQGRDTGFSLDAKLSEQLRDLAKAEQTTLYTVLLSGFYVTLAALTGQTDIVLGTPSDNRDHGQTQSLVGFFVNSLALRTEVKPDLSIKALIQQVHKTVTQAKVHQALPFEKLVDVLDIERDLSRHPIYQVMFTVQHLGDDSGDGENNHSAPISQLPFESAQASQLQNLYSPAKVDLSLFLTDSQDDQQGSQICGGFNYAVSLFDEATIARVEAMYQRVLRAFVDTQQQTQPLEQIELLSAHERHTVLHEWNQTNATYPEGTLHALFEARVQENPDDIALVFEAQQLTYRQLNTQADQLAQVIRANYRRSYGKPMAADTLVALYLDRSVDVVVSILAVLKAGGAYVPVSPEAPLARAQFILEDTQTPLILTQQRHQQTLATWADTSCTQVIILAVDDSATYCHMPPTHQEADSLKFVKTGAKDLAYVIYTSGTTGKPKGVMISHQNVAHLSAAQNERFGFADSLRALVFADFVFDASVFELFCPLLNGSTVYLCNECQRHSPEALGELIKQAQIELAVLPPAMLSLMTASDLRSLKTLVTAGESPSRELLERFSCLGQFSGQCRVFNAYGPTEITVCATANEYQTGDSAQNIGQPINNTRVFVLDESKRPVPIGTPGELYVGGAGVARGYLNRPDLSAERFIDNPFASQIEIAKGEARLYKTGDLVRWLPETTGASAQAGRLEFLGRNDFQVKIRGYRVELGEIESVLNDLPEVAQAVVIDRKRKDSSTQSQTYLAAYIVIEQDKHIDAETLQERLKAPLPDYMLPTTFTFISAIPLTINGKLNRSALPEPEMVSHDSYVAPSNALEEQLCGIWQSVLGIEKIGVEDNFFRIGGNSITAIRLTSVMRSELSTDVPLAVLFEQPRISKLARYLAEQVMPEMVVIPHVEQTHYPLSFAQERLLFIESFEQGTDAYHIPYLLKLPSNVDIALLEKAINQIVTRHPVLKSIYLNDGSRGSYQSVLAGDLSIKTSPLNTVEEFLSAVKKDTSQPFDLSGEAPMRLHHYHVNSHVNSPVNCPVNGSEVQYMMFLWHHIAFDGWSRDVFMGELNEAYRALMENRAPVLPTLDIHYGDYAVWQRDFLSGENLENLTDYWQQQLSGFETLALLSDYPRPAQIDYRGKDFGFELSPELSEHLRQLAQSQQTTIYTVLLSAFYVTLATLTGQKDIVVGTPSDNRQHAQTQSLIGFFVNSLVLRAQVEPQQSVLNLIAQVHKVVTQAKVHQELPFEQLLDMLNIDRDTSRHPIYQVMFTAHSGEQSDTREHQTEAGSQNQDSVFTDVSAADVDTVDLDVGEQNFYSPAKFDLSLSVSDVRSNTGDTSTETNANTNSVITGCFNYAVSLFDEASVARMAAIYEQVLSAFVDAQQQSLPVVDIQLLSRQERNKVLYDWNQTDAPYPQSSVCQLFEAQVLQNPNDIALVFEDTQLMYCQLNERANQLAHALSQHYQQCYQQAISADTLIVLYLDRSVEMVVSILAVLKAGGAWVPVSPEYPQARAKFIFEDTKAPFIITQQRHLALLTEWTETSDQPVVLLAADEINALKQMPVSNPSFAHSVTDLAYVIYTSGTTGQAKGVMISHQNIAHLSAAQNQCFAAAECKRTLMFASYVFDASVFELFVSLFNGSTVYLCSEQQRLSADETAQLICQAKIEMATLPPTMLSLMDAEDLASLKTLVSAGESPSSELLERFSAGGECRVFNAYGPTETTVCASAHQYQPGDLPRNIGRAINNTQLYVLDTANRPVPPGALGELYVGGAGLARGYLNRPDLSAQRFIINPFASKQDKLKGYDRLYKTGDLARWLVKKDGGEIEYLGRNDFQVKIRGFRIELGEIESALRALPELDQAVVIDRVRTSGNKQPYLAAYLVSSQAIDLDINIDSIKAALSTSLPDYMIPVTFTKIDVVPLTINGKLDRRALPEPEFIQSECYVEPRNELEIQLCAIWQAALGLERVGIDDNFFRIGGDSIVSIQLVAKLRRAGFTLQVKDIFDAPKVSQLASLLGSRGDDASSQIAAEQGLLSGDFPLLPIQQWFFDKSLAEPQHWNQAFMLRIPADINAQQIEQALAALAEHHDMLRCRFEQSEQGWSQRYSPSLGACMAPLVSADIRLFSQEQHDVELHRLLSMWQSDFDYAEGPLWRVGHLSGYSDGSARLFFALHHLIVDGVSWRIIAQDMQQLLNGQALPPKTSSYRQWVEAVQAYGENHQGEAKYWRDVVAQQAPLPALEADESFAVGLSEDLTDVLLRQANQGYYSEINDLLLSALAIALKQTFSRDVNHITLEGHGREAIDSAQPEQGGMDTSGTVGWFTTVFPVKLLADKHVSDTIIQTKEMLRAIPNKGIGFGALNNTDELNAELPTVSFNYLGQLGSQTGDQADNSTHVECQLVSEGLGQMIGSKNTDDLLLNINGAVQNGVLQFGVVSRLSPELSQQFAKAFEAALQAVTRQGQLQALQGGLKTPSDYGTRGLAIEHLRHLQQRFQQGLEHEIAEIYPATSLQQGFVYHYLSQPQDDAYRVQLLLDYQQGLDFKAYREAWRLTSLRYPILRMAFDWQDQILQVFSSQPCITDKNFSVKDISACSEHQRDQAIAKIQREDRAQPFDLAQPGLIRFTLIKQHDNIVTVLKTEHHGITDGWSSPIVLQTVHDYYDQLVQGAVPSVTPETAYFEAQRWTVEQEEKTKAYWDNLKSRFTGINDINALLSEPLDLSQPTVVEQPKEQLLTVQGEHYHQLKAMCQTQGITLNVAMQFAWHKLLQSYTRDEQTIVGTTVSGRDIPVAGIESSVGLYINTLPLAIDWAETATSSAILQEIQQQIAALNSHSSVSLASLQKEGQRLFHSLFVFENYPIPVDSGQTQTGEVQINEPQKSIGGEIAFRQAVEKVDYPLSVVAFEHHEGVSLRLSYDLAWLSDAQAGRLLKQLECIVTAISTEPNLPHQEISLLDEAESHMLLHDWTQTEAQNPNTSLHQLFEAQVLQAPDKTALVFENQRLSYRELNERANQLACVIRSRFADAHQKVMPKDTLIGLYFDRGVDMVISILAVLKAGGVYVPISPEYPKPRSKFIFSDTKAAILLSQSQYQNRLEDWLAEQALPTQLLMVDEALSKNALNKNVPSETVFNYNVAPLSGPQDLAYVIYTSGTTGQPKGVMQSHGNVVRLLAATQEEYQFSRDDVWTLFHATTFDFAVWELWGALSHGGTLVVPTGECVVDSQAFAQLCIKENVSVLNQTPAAFSAFAATVIDNDWRLAQLRLVIFGGDALNIESLKPWWKRFGDTLPQLVNMYGITETCVHVTAKKLSADMADNALDIGRPLKDMKAYVLSSSGKPVPVGVPGELYVGGAGLARGYLNQSALSSQRFIESPFATQAEKANSQYDTRLYKTGDLVRWLARPNGAPGHLEYLGRNDFQVKIRGFRIELGEIESALSALPEVRQAVVMTRKQTQEYTSEAQNYLAAYFVSEPDHAVQIDSLMSQLRSQLPAHMLPATLTQLDAVPLTINGKIDRRALPDPDFVDADTYIAPRDELETQLCAIWQGVLGLDQVGIEDNFFQAGGNSISAISLISQVNRHFNVKLSVANLFLQATIKAFSDEVKNHQVQENLLKWLTPKPGSQSHSSQDNSHIAKMFMVHPGGGGCEVYRGLASQLKNDFECIGIDNLNMLSDKRIGSLQKISETYLTAVESLLPKYEAINLVGWSLGGTIALEMAAQLEQRGYKDIYVYLLDTHAGPTIDKDMDPNTLEKINQRQRASMLEQGVSGEYIDSILLSRPYESQIASSDLSQGLEHTQVILLKAGKLGVNEYQYLTDEEAFLSAKFSVPDNNISKLIKAPLKVVLLERYDHQSLLGAGEEIKQAIANNCLIPE